MPSGMVAKVTPKKARKDLMKILHYAVIQLYIHDEENKTKFVNDQHEHGYPEYDGKLGPWSSYAIERCVALTNGIE